VTGHSYSRLSPLSSRDRALCASCTFSLQIFLGPQTTPPCATPFKSLLITTYSLFSPWLPLPSPRRFLRSSRPGRTMEVAPFFPHPLIVQALPLTWPVSASGLLFPNPFVFVFGAAQHPFTPPSCRCRDEPTLRFHLRTPCDLFCSYGRGSFRPTSPYPSVVCHLVHSGPHVFTRLHWSHPFIRDENFLISSDSFSSPFPLPPFPFFYETSPHCNALFSLPPTPTTPHQP